VSSKVQWVIIAALVSLLGIGLWSARSQLGAELFPLRIGSDAPDFTALPMAPGAEAKGIDDYRGQVVLLNIWATWCGPCRVEMPSMERLEQQLGPKGLKIVAVSVDVSGMESRINEFVEEMQLSFEILHDAPGTIKRQYQTTAVPETFIIGRDGKLRRRVIGADDWASPANVAFLERLLAEPAPR
jgi:cytochrome c biogenesis protein CcmG/thiol:disulfide interchange protein DsbE